MPTIREVKKRIASVSKIRKVASALEIVAATRLKRIEAETLKFRPYAQGIKDMFINVASRTKEKHPLLTESSHRSKNCIIIISSDKGLCGAFNANVINKAKGLIDAAAIITIGKKCRTYFKRKRKDLFLEYTDLDYKKLQGLVDDLTPKIIEAYLKGRFSKVQIIFNKFRLQLLGKVEIVQLLPAQIKEKSKNLSEYIYEPSAKYILDKLIPAYIENQIKAAILESFAAEEMARMVAMKYATDNADELINKLNLVYHKARQANITREIIEVISGTYR